MHPSLRRSVALALAEAVHTGSPLVWPPEAAPRSITEGSRIASLALEALDLVPCGWRLAPGPDGPMLAGPMLEGRLLPNDATVPLVALRHSLAAAAVIGVLAADLTRAGTAAPAFAALHPAIDIGGWRLRDPPNSAALATADLAGLGLLVAGRGSAKAAATVRLGFGPDGVRRRTEPMDVPGLLAAAAAAARRAGGLPRGAVLVAVVGGGIVPTAGLRLSASLTGLGTVRASFA